MSCSTSHAGSAARALARVHASRVRGTHARVPRRAPARRRARFGFAPPTPPASPAPFPPRARRRALIIDTRYGHKASAISLLGEWIHTVGAELVWTPRASPCSPASWDVPSPAWRCTASSSTTWPSWMRFCGVTVGEPRVGRSVRRARRGRIADVARAESGARAWPGAEPPRRAFGGGTRDSRVARSKNTSLSFVDAPPTPPPPSPPPRRSMSRTTVAA